MLPTTETVWAEFNTGLKRFILKHVQDETSAEDILQDVFLKIHMHLSDLRDTDKLQSWIYQITRNAIRDFYRVGEFIPDILEMAYVAEDPFDDVVSDLLPYVKKLVDELPYDYRQALVLTEYDEKLREDAIQYRMWQTVVAALLSHLSLRVKAPR